MMMSSSFILSMTTSSQLEEKEDYIKFGMVEDDSTYIYTKDVSETAKPSTPGTL